MCVGTQNTIYRLLIHLYCLFIMQCLQALEKISHEQPLACLQSGAIMAVLAFIDFFSTSVQVMYYAVWFKFRNSVHSDSIRHLFGVTRIRILNFILIFCPFYVP